MAEISWWQIIPSFIGGGLAGAIITQLVTTWRGRLQPIGYSIEPEISFNRNPLAASVSAYITIVPSDGSDPESFENISLVDVLITNRGNKDYATFRFGLTLAEDNSAIVTECVGEDRHHTISCINNPTISKPTRELNFSLSPFNRKDVYKVKLYVVLPADKEKPGEILIGSEETGVRLIPIPSIADMLSQTLIQGVRLGVFTISIK